MFSASLVEVPPYTLKRKVNYYESYASSIDIIKRWMMNLHFLLLYKHEANIFGIQELLSCAGDVIWNSSLLCSNRAAEPRSQVPTHTPAHPVMSYEL